MDDEYEVKSNEASKMSPAGDSGGGCNVGGSLAGPNPRRNGGFPMTNADSTSKN